MRDDLILQLYSRPETVFTVDQIAQLFPKSSIESIRDRLYYFTKVGKLRRLHQGVYAKDNFNPLELANKVYRPSYISLETVLAKEGVVFQHYKTIFVVSYLTRMLTIQGSEIQYRQIQGGVLANVEGIQRQVGYFIASRERAFLDAVAIYKNYHFDNLGALDWAKVDSLKQLYKSRVLEKRVEEYQTIYREEYGKH